MPDYSYSGKLSLYPYDTRFRAIAPPTAGIFDEPQMSICFNVEWAAHIDGVLSRLIWTDAWIGTDETKQWAVGEVTKLLVSMIARNPCGGGDCMSECCDEIVERLEAIEAILLAKAKKTPEEIRDEAVATQEAYEDYLEATDAIYEDDITNVHPDMQYGDANDPLRDQALCFMTRRFVDIICDWVVSNIKLKQANQQTALNVASIVGGAADLLGRLFGETAFGQMFQNIDLILELEVAALTQWVTTVSVDQLSIFESQEARHYVACAWYDQLKGATPTAATFVSSLNAAVVSGDADVIRDKIADALVPVTEPQQPDPEHVFFIWGDLWQQAYDGVEAGIVPDCLCDDTEARIPVINTIWDSANGARGTIEGPDENGFYTATSEAGPSDEAIHIMDIDERPFVLTEVTYSAPTACQVFHLEGVLIHIGCGGGNAYIGQTIDEYVVTWSLGATRVMQFKMIAP